jgi:RHS repeat-associated protein
MARLARVVAAGLPHHVTQRGNRRQQVFFGDEDYATHRALLAESCGAAGGAVQWNQYLYAGGEMVGVRYDYNNAPTAIRYFDKDNLGSIATITDEGGTVVERDSFDAWGKRRFPNGNDDPGDSITSLTTRGYTGQEELADVGLVHLNGRVYDPLIGRFTSADPVAAQPYETQGFDRYAYVNNNPLAFTDPNGFCGFFCVLGHIFNPVQVFNDQISVLKAIYSVPYLGQALNIATAAVVTYYTGGCVQCGIAVSSALSSLQAGVTSGKLGEALKAGAISYAEAEAFYGVGTATGFHGITWDKAISEPGTFALNIAGHAAVGCITAEAQGGDCGTQALAAGISAAAAPAIYQGFGGASAGDVIGGTIASAAVGGVSSIAGGGKFENGAVTAGFGYLFNAMGKMWGRADGIAAPNRAQLEALGVSEQDIETALKMQDRAEASVRAILGRLLVNGPDGPVDVSPDAARILTGRILDQYSHDGSVFYNREDLLPRESMGYYTEYVVPTPGANNAGTQRIVTGADGEIYYTPDHYKTFQRVK